MKKTSHQNAKLTGLRHDETKNLIILSFAEHEDWPIHGVVDFSLTGFFPQNILFGIDEYDLNILPARIAAEYPVLSYYLHSGENWQIFHLSPQAGLGGIIVCATF